MANEFIIRKGYKSLASSEITGSLSVSGSNISIVGADTPFLNIKDTTNDLTGKIRVANSYVYFEADQNNSVGSTRLVLKTDGTQFLYGDQSQNVFIPTGDVGIGTTTASHMLTVRGPVSASAYYGDGSNLSGISVSTPTLDQVTDQGSTTTNSIQVSKLIASQSAYTDGVVFKRAGHDEYRITLGNSEGLRIVNQTDSSREELKFSGTGHATFSNQITSGRLNITDAGVPIMFTESGNTGTGKYWRQVLDAGDIRFDVDTTSTNGDGSFSSYNALIQLNADGHTDIKGNLDVVGTGLSTIAGQLYVGQTSDYFGTNTNIQLNSGASNKNVGIRSNILYLYAHGNGSDAALIFGDGSANFSVVSSDTDFNIYNYNTSTNPLTILRSNNYTTFTGNVEVDTAFKVNAPDGGSSPAMTAIMNMHGYEGRGVGIKMRDSVNSASSPSNREWFVGTGYNQSGFNIGYASDGSQSSYTAQAKLSIGTNGNAVFAGNVQIGGFDDGSNYSATIGWNAVDSEAVGTKRSALTFKTSQTGVNQEDIYKWDIAMIAATATVSGEEFGSDLAFLRSTRSNTYADAPSLILGRTGDATFAGDVTIAGTLTAQEFKTEFVSASILYDSGSTKFGDTSDDIHSFSGSLRVTGSGAHYFTNGNVGIGTATPGVPLHVYAAESTIKFQSSHGREGSINQGGGNFHLHAAHGSGVAINYGNLSHPGLLKLYNNTTAKVQVNANGDSYYNGGSLGIGTTSPNALLNLSQANGANIRFDNESTTNYFTIGEGVGTNNIFSFRGNSYRSTDTLSIDFANDRVGIGVIAPEKRLHVKTATSDATPQVLVQNSSTGDASILLNVSGQSYVMGIDQDDSKKFKIASSGNLGTTDRVTLLSTGQVGIGTITPSQKLHVVGNIYSVNSGTDGGQIRLANSGGGSNWYWAARTTGLNLGELGAADGRIFIANGGNVGIGTTTLSDGDLTINTPKLHIKGLDTAGAYNLVARFQAGNDSDNTGASILINHSNDRGLLIKAGRKDSDREIAYFDVISSGANITNMLTMGKYGNDYRVGVRTTAPASVFHVNTGTGTGNQNTVFIDRAGSSDYSGISFATAGTVDWSIGHNSAGNFEIYEDGQDAKTRVTVEATSGDVGIGSSSPGNKLDVMGNVSASAYYGDGSNLTGISADGGNATTLDGIDSTSFFRSDAADTGIGFATYTNINSSGDAGLGILSGGRLGFDQSGTRSWTVKAASGQLQFNSGDGGGSVYFGIDAYFNNKQITGLNNLAFNDPGPNEGIAWSGGNWKIYESPNDLTTNTAGNLQFVSGSTRVLSIGKKGEAALEVIGSGSTVFEVVGSQGQLFSVTDDLSGTLFAVSDISGTPLLEVDADSTITMGDFGTNALVVTGSNIGIGTASPAYPLHAYSGGSERFAVSGDVFVRGATDLKITGTSRRVSFDAGTGTVRTSTANNLYLQSNNSTVLELKSNLEAEFTGNVALGDGKLLKFGASDDYQIYHNSTTNVNHIFSNLDRQLSLNANTINFTNQANDSTVMVVSGSRVKIGGTHAATSQLHIKNISGDNRGIMVENSVAASYAEVALKSDTREFRLGTGGSGTNNANAQNLFYVYDATTGGAAGHRFEINSNGDVQARRPRSNTAGEVALSVQPTDSTIHYGFRIDQATNSINLDRVDSAGQLLRIDTSGNATFTGYVKSALSSDGNGKFYAWRAIENTSGTSNTYFRIAKITGGQSTRFSIELTGRSTSYSDGTFTAWGKLVGQLNNDNNYDLTYYDFKTADSEVVTEIGQVDVSTSQTSIYVKIGQFAEIAATAYISDGSITTYDTNDGSSSAPTGYVAAARSYTMWHSGNDGPSSGLDADTVDGLQAVSFLRSDVSDVVNNGSIISFSTSGGNVRGYLQSTDTNDEHFIIATSGGEDIAFKDGGTAGNTNLIIRGDGSMIQPDGQFINTVSSGNNIEVRKGNGSGAIAFGGTAHQTGLFEGVDGGGLKLYTAGNDVNWGGAWTLGTTWAGNDMTQAGRITGGEHILAANNVYANGTQGFVFGQSVSEGEYIYRTGNDIAFVAGGTTRMTVDGDAGNVGIGDTSPTSISANTFSLSVNSSRTDLSGALITKANGTIKHQQYWDSSGYGFNLSASSGDFRWLVNNSEKMRITSGGNIGIGTTTPAANLQVVGSGGTVLDIQGSQGQLFSVTDDLTGDLFTVSDISGVPILNVNASGEVKIDGKLGIGATAGDFHADADNLIVGDGVGNTGITIHSGTTGFGSIFFADGTANDATEKRGQIRYLQGTERMDFHTDNVATAALSLAANSNATFAGGVSAPGLVYNSSTKYLSISHWSSPPTPAAMLHLSDNSNSLDVPQIRIEGRENPGDTVLDIAVKDADVRFNLVEGSTDATSGYGRMHFKTNASANSSNPTRGGFLFTVGPNSSLVNALDITNQGNAIFAGNVGMATGNSTGKFAVMSTAVHGSYDFYNNGTSYFNGAVIVDAAFSQTGGGTSTFSGRTEMADLRLRKAGTSDQTTTTDTTTAPAGGNELIRFEGNYTDGRYTHELVKIDRGGNLPLYLQESKGTANSFVNLVRFGTHSNSTHEFEVFGQMKTTGVTVAGNTTVSGTVGIGTTSPGAKLEVFGTGNSLRLDSAANQSKTILFRNVGSGTAEIKTDGDLKLNAEDSDKTIQLFTENTERMRVTEEGTLHVKSNHAHGNIYLDYQHGDTTNSGTLTAWVSEPGMTYHTAGIGANIHKSGPYYGRAINAGYGTYIRFHKDTGNITFANTTSTSGNSSGQGSIKFTMSQSGTFTAVGDVVAFSDSKLKENVKTLEGDKVLQMRGVSFDRKDTGKKGSGVIAQEVQKVAPELVHENKDGTLGVAYGNLTGYLIEAVKDLKKEIEDLKGTINKLQSEK